MTEMLFAPGESGIPLAIQLPDSSTAASTPFTLTAEFAGAVTTPVKEIDASDTVEPSMPEATLAVGTSMTRTLTGVAERELPFVSVINAVSE